LRADIFRSEGHWGSAGERRRDPENTVEGKLTLSVVEAARACGLGRTSLYNAISTGRLRARKHGRRTLVAVEDLKTWLASLPVLASSR